jgi:hypothetical protein
VSDLPEAYLVHRTPGRLRLKIPSRKGDISYFASLGKQLSGLDGVDKVMVNPLTGSALFIHNANRAMIAEYAMANNLFSLKRLDSYPTGLQQRVSETFNGFNAQMKVLTCGEIDMGGLAFLALLGAGIYQISRGNIAAIPWYAAFWYALNIFLKAKPGKGIE